MKIRNIILSLVCVLVIAVSSFYAAAIEWEGLGEGSSVDETVDKTEAVDELVLSAENNLAKLYYNEATAEMVLETAENERFSSLVSCKYAGYESSAEENIGELFSFLVFNPKTRSTQNFSSGDEKVSLVYSKQNGGFDVKAQKDDISFTVSFRLDGGQLTVSVPFSSVSEKDERLVSITLLPLFGACNSSEDGYIFYPDGSGTLYKFKDKVSVNRSAVTKLIYGDAFNELDNYISDREHNIMPISLPVFGIKRANNAIFAQVEKGDADTSLTLAPIGYVYNLARVYPTFNYRYSYYEQTVSGDKMLVFNDMSTASDFSVKYTVLSDVDASYIGMAKLLRKEMFADTKKNEKPNISVDLLMSTQKSLLLWDISREVTSFEQAEEFLETLETNGVSNARLNLLGWQSKGYNNYPAHLPVSRKIGGNSGLKKLTEYAHKNGSVIQLLDNFAEGDFEGSGFSIRQDAAYNMKNKPLSDIEQTKLLMDIANGYAEFKKDISKLANSGIDGYSFDLFGSLVYDNMASGRTLRRQEYISKVNEYLDLSNQSFGSSAMDGANYYAVKNAGFIYNLPDSSSGEFIYDEDVPFLQIVLHGYKAYSGRNFGNFSNSTAEAALHWLEYGYVPSFVLGYESPSILKDTKSEGFFYSRIDDWTDTIGEIYKDFLPAYEKIKNETITDYIKKGNTCEIAYENGMKLLINYNKQDTLINGINVGAESYIIN